jgi:hypothetical protein
MQGVLVSVVVRIVEQVGDVTRPYGNPEGLFLRAWDVDAYDGRGDCDLTMHRDRAHRFATAEDAMRVWRSQSTVRPRRADGKPNRPLTVFTVQVEPA